jgi:hypothetical protein
LRVITVACEASKPRKNNNEIAAWSKLTLGLEDHIIFIEAVQRMIDASRIIVYP